MADETQVAGEQKPLEAQPVTLKPSAIEPAAKKEDWKGSNVPYHNAETEQIAKDRAEEIKGWPKKDYEYHANGYTVKEVKSSPQIASGDRPGVMIDGPEVSTFMVTADGFEKGFSNQRDAEIYAETHAPHVKDSIDETNVTNLGSK